MTALDRLSCARAFQLLDDYLDRELGLDERRRVEEHLRDCATCAQEFLFEAAVMTGIRAKLAQLDMPAQLLERVLAQLPDPNRAET